jgi:hypothetical protein
MREPRTRVAPTRRGGFHAALQAATLQLHLPQPLSIRM